MVSVGSTQPGRAARIAYWLLAAFCVWGLALAIFGALDDPAQNHWRFILWWVALFGALMLRFAGIVLIYAAFLMDSFDGLMRLIYTAQPDPATTILILLAPLVPLAVMLWLWRRAFLRTRLAMTRH